MNTFDQQKYELFYGLIKRHISFIERMCMRRASGNSSLCAELMQECFICIWKHEKQLSSEMSPKQEKVWVYWLCRSAFLRVRFLYRSHLWVPVDENIADTIADTDDSISLREQIESLSSVLNKRERQALNLILEGYSPDEMARLLGIKPRSAVQLRYRIKTKLRKHYNGT